MQLQHQFVKQVMKKISLSLLSLLIAMRLYAVVATPQPVTVTQPDGTQITLQLHGDEHFSYRTTIDNYFVARDSQGRYCYVNYMPDGTYAMTGVVAHDPDFRSVTEKQFVNTLDRELPCKDYVINRRRVGQQANFASTYPRVGSPRSIILLVNFTDIKFKHDPKDFNRLCNESNYSDNKNRGSCRDFFIAQSDSLFQPQFDIYGPYQLAHSQEYYGGNSGSNSSQRAGDMIIEACGKAMSDGVDFSLYDCDNDGVVDNVYVFYAGHGEADTGEESAIWPHRSVVNTAPDYNGKSIHDYACSAELRGNGGMTTIGTFCHEFGHVIGLPDYYDTKDNTKETIGAWDIMCSGSYNGPNGYSGATPPSYSAHSRWWLGWRTDIEQLTNVGTYVLDPVEKSGSRIYMIAEGKHNMNPTAMSEFFILENRQEVGWDKSTNRSSIPATGMLVWHVNYSNSLWSNNIPNSEGALNYFVEAANGKKRTAGTRNDTYPGQLKRTEFNPVLINGTNLYQPIFGITQQPDSTISFIYKSASENPFTVFPTELPQLESAFDPEKKTYTYADVSEIFISSDSIDPSVPIQITTSDVQIAVSLDSSVWKSYNDPLVIKLTDSIVSQRVYVRFRPSRMYCHDSPLGGLITVKQGNNMQPVSFTAIAPRQTQVTSPEGLSVSDITPFSCLLQWDAVADASRYYLTAYQLSDGETQFMQSFEKFDNQEEVAVAGWQTNVNELTSTYKSDGSKSLYIKNTADYVISQHYIMPITSLSFWCAAYNTSLVDTIGYLKLEAFDGTEWQTVNENIPLLAGEKTTKNFSFSETDNYTQFQLTFTDNGGKGFALDQFTAVCNHKINYLDGYTNRQIDTLSAVRQSTIIGNLQPGTLYHVYVQASDEGRGGCTATVTAPSQIVEFATINGDAGEKALTYAIDSIAYDRTERVIYIPVVDQAGTLRFYDAMGHLVTELAVDVDQNRVPLPVADFRTGQLYIAKFSTGGIKRRDRRTTFVY